MVCIAMVESHCFKCSLLSFHWGGMIHIVVNEMSLFFVRLNTRGYIYKIVPGIYSTLNTYYLPFISCGVPLNKKIKRHCIVIERAIHRR